MRSHTQPERHIPLEGCYNLRDVGGYPTEDGYRTRWRTIFRSDSLHRLPPTAQQILIDYGLRTVIDVRWIGEASWEPNVFEKHPTVQYRFVPFHGEKNPYALNFPNHMSQVYNMYLEQEKSNIKAIIECILEADTVPMLIHCTAGKDRTGIIITLLLGIMRVPVELIIEEYALSEKYLAPYFNSLRQQARSEDLQQYGYFLDCKSEFMRDTIAYLNQRYNGIIGYVRAIGISDEQIIELREMLLEKQDNTVH